VRGLPFQAADLADVITAAVASVSDVHLKEAAK
jgi:2-oxoglutarate ferredoxin oxidoreductase subunit alpha